MLHNFCGAAIDWDATGSFLSGTAGWAGIAALIWATFKGRQTFKDYREQKQTEKQIDAAERVLTAAYNCRSAIEGIRANLMEGSELERAEATLVEQGHDLKALTDDKKRRAITAQAFYNRMNQFRADFDAVWDVTPIALAYFGDDIHDALRTIAHQRRVIQVSADSYVQDDGSDKAFSIAVKRDLWTGHGKSAEEDPVANKVDEAIKLLEERMHPILRADLPGKDQSKKEPH